MITVRIPNIMAKIVSVEIDLKFDFKNSCDDSGSSGLIIPPDGEASDIELVFWIEIFDKVEPEKFELDIVKLYVWSEMHSFEVLFAI